MSPSARSGVNSVPNRVASRPAAIGITAAAATTTTRSASALRSKGAYSSLRLRITLVSFSATRPVTNCATAAGTKVSDKAIAAVNARSEEHTSELQSLMRISYAVFCLKKKINTAITKTRSNTLNIQKPYQHLHTDI